MPPLTARLGRAALSLLPIYNGKGRIIDRSFLRNTAFGVTELKVDTIDGPMYVNPDDLIGRHLYLTRTFDRCVVDSLVSLARAGDTLWDIGANVGYISLAFLNRVPKSRVLAVEPLADVFGMLTRNLPADRAACIRCAVSDRGGRGAMVRTPGNLGHSHLGNTGEDVELMTGSELATHGRPDLIKIDTEGHEAAVLRGIGPLLANVRAVAFECHEWPEKGVQETLAGAGLTVRNIARRWNGWRLTPCDATPRGYEASHDFVAVRDGGVKA